MNLKLCCDECSTIFYVLKYSFECPQCGHKVNPKHRFSKNQNLEEEAGPTEEDSIVDTQANEEDPSAESPPLV